MEQGSPLAAELLPIAHALRRSGCLKPTDRPWRSGRNRAISVHEVLFSVARLPVVFWETWVRRQLHGGNLHLASTNNDALSDVVPSEMQYACMKMETIINHSVATFPGIAITMSAGLSEKRWMRLD